MKGMKCKSCDKCVYITFEFEKRDVLYYCCNTEPVKHIRKCNANSLPKYDKYKPDWCPLDIL